MGLSAIPSGHVAGFMTMTAGASAALLLAVATPARGLPFDLQSAARSAPVPAFQQPARPQLLVTARRAKAAAKEEPVDEVVAKAKAAKQPYNVVISIEKQQLTLYSGTEVIARSRVSTGTASHPTPTGVFSIIQRNRWHRSNLYGNAPMWFMQRITWSGVAMHEGVVPGYPASHGCIRLPAAFAKSMWSITEMGARVIVAKPELEPVAIAHSSLFSFKPEPEPEAPKPDPGETVASSNDVVRAAYGALATDAFASTRSAAGPTATDLPKQPDPTFNAAAKEKPLKPGPISVFISRKEGKIFVRKGFQPVFDAPVSIAEPDQPLGTHVFTALSFKDDNSTLNWMVVTVPTSVAPPKRTAKPKKGERVEVAGPTPIHTTAAEALARVIIPDSAIERISSLMSPGASLVISDQGLGPETGKGTDFIVPTR
jgi:lipoprotein-anchoring transpeptidase ErfK/SrfK